MTVTVGHFRASDNAFVPKHPLGAVALTVKVKSPGTLLTFAVPEIRPLLLRLSPAGIDPPARVQLYVRPAAPGVVAVSWVEYGTYCVASGTED